MVCNKNSTLYKF